MATAERSASTPTAVQRVHSAVEILRSLGLPFALQLPDGEVLSAGAGEPAFRVVFKTERGLRTPFTDYALGTAYMRGDIDIEGDLLALLDVRDKLRDAVKPADKVRFAAQLFLRSPTSVNVKAVGHHYNFGDDFYLSFIDTRFRLYSQCVFQDDEESLEEAAENKLRQMWDALELRPGMRLLDIGGGWGAVTEYCGARGVHVTTLTLAPDSAAYVRNLLRERELPGEVLVEDVLDHRPSEPYDHAVMLGVIEHVPNYRRFCERIWDGLKVGGRLYLDASAALRKYEVSTFTRRYIYRGTHTFLALPDLIQELLLHGFEIVRVRRETRDYHLTMRHWAERLDDRRKMIVEKWGEELYRAFRLYLWGGSHALKVNRLQAYHLLAERRADAGPRPGIARRTGSFLLSLR